MREGVSAAYEEGDWFAVPLRDGGFGVGVAARSDRSGVVVGYFFAPRRSKVPGLDEVSDLSPDEALLVRMFGDLSLVSGEWPVIGRSDSWDRGDWPLPVFGRREDLTGRPGELNTVTRI